MSSPQDIVIACFGAAHIDRHAHASSPVVLGSSNPVSVMTAPGGVARNVAESLARLGRRVTLVSRVGADADGDRIVAAMTDLGVDMGVTTRSDSSPTAGYTALVGPDGELVVALADMAIYDELTPAVLGRSLKHLPDRALWFADCNLSADCIGFLRDAKPPGTVLAIDTVSVSKARRVGGALDAIDLLFCNLDEAAALTGGTVPNAEAPARAAAALRSRGDGTVVIGMGADGIFVAGPDGSHAMPAARATVRDVTGAGDALVAGTLFGVTGGRPILESARLGLAAAAMAVESDRAVSPVLTSAALLTRAGLAG